MKHSDDIHIQVLRFGRDNPGFSIEDLKGQFPSDFDWIYREVQHGRLLQSDRAHEDAKYFLSFDDRSKLLEVEELHEARKSSRNAMYIAIASILLTLAGLGVQILMGFAN